MRTRQEFEQLMRAQADRLTEESGKIVQEWTDAQGMFRRLVPHTLSDRKPGFGCITEIKCTNTIALPTHIVDGAAYDEQVYDIARGAKVPECINDVKPGHFEAFIQGQLAAYDHFHPKEPS